MMHADRDRVAVESKKKIATERNYLRGDSLGITYTDAMSSFVDMTRKMKGLKSALVRLIIKKCNAE